MTIPRIRSFVSKTVSIAALGLFVSSLTTIVACTGAAPYERGKLAHPTMTTSDLAGPGEQHVRAVQEGAIGGQIGVGGGCGCN